MLLAEVKKKVDYSSLTNVWQSNAFNDMISALSARGETLGFFAKLLSSAKQKHSAASPEAIFSVVNSTVKSYIKLISSDGGWISYTDRESFLHFFNHLTNTVIDIGSEEALKLFNSKVNIEELSKHLSGSTAARLKLALQKVSRSRAQRKMDEENELFVFIGRPAFKEVQEGSGNFKKTLEIEQMIKIDKFDLKHHGMVEMMKLRANFQGEKSEVYQITLPAGTLVADKTSSSDIPDWLLNLIDEHKVKVS